MKTLFAGLLIGLFLLEVSCGSSSKSRAKIIQKVQKKIYLFDHVDSVQYNFFRYLFYQNETKANTLIQRVPNGYEEIDYILYVTSSKSSPATAQFSKEIGGNGRDDQASSFLNSLAKLIGPSRSYADKSILKALNEIFREVDNDTSVYYQIEITSDMIENIGGPIHASSNLSEEQLNWENGEFRFVTGEGECITQALDEAKRQLDDSSSWIYKHLISRNKIEANKHIIIVLNQQKQPPISKLNNGGCDELDINLFWKLLFKRMKIKLEYK